MSEISETEIKSMSKEQNYMRGYEDGKSDVLDKIRDEIDGAKLPKNRMCFFRDGIECALQIIDKYKTESEVEK